MTLSLKIEQKKNFLFDTTLVNYMVGRVHDPTDRRPFSS